MNVLSEVFGISDDEIPSIWPKVAARHEALFGDQTVDQIDYQGF